MAKSDSDDDSSQNEEEEGTTAVKVEKNQDESSQCKFIVLKLLFVYFTFYFVLKLDSLN